MDIQVIYEFGPYRLDPTTFTLTCNGAEVHVRSRCLDILLALAMARGRVLSSRELRKLVWGGNEVEENNLTVNISHLRKALGEGYIENIPGSGYLLAVKVAERPASAAKLPPGPPGGALPPDSPIYVVRAMDQDFYAALDRRDSIVLLQGPRQSGKTSLLARGLQRARKQGSEVVCVDFQELTADTFASVEKLLMTLEEILADRLGLETLPHETWSNFLGPGSNFQRFLQREVLSKVDTPLLWALDEVDRVSQHPYRDDFFALLRWFHNQRALSPDGPWRRLTLALAYATESHHLIKDPNQSPFNVGTRVAVEDFTLAQVGELNRLYGSPLDDAGLACYFGLVGGHPYLVQCGFYEMTAHGMDLAGIRVQADREQGLFGNHLHSMWERHLKHNDQLCQAMRKILRGDPGLGPSDFHRLRSAGIISGDTPAEARPRCQLYAAFLARQLL